jgi:hypothetical protein
MTLLVDTFWEQAQARLVSAGWVIVDGSRYDPTIINGVTPTGRSFTFRCEGGIITITIAGRVRTIERSRDLWEPGDATVDAMIAARNLLPVNQR